MNKPLLVEKSITMSSYSLTKFLKKNKINKSKIFFAYNRNYYDYIFSLIREIKKNNSLKYIDARFYDPYSKIVMHIAPFTHTTKDYNDTCHKCGEYVPSDGFWDRWDNEPPVKQPDGSIQYRGHVGCSFMHPSELTELYNIGWPVEFIDDIIYDKCIYPSRLEIDKEIKEFYESR